MGNGWDYFWDCAWNYFKYFSFFCFVLYTLISVMSVALFSLGYCGPDLEFSIRCESSVIGFFVTFVSFPWSLIVYAFLLMALSDGKAVGLFAILMSVSYFAALVGAGITLRTLFIKFFYKNKQQLVNRG